MDIHTRIVAVLHIVIGVIGIAMLMIGAIAMRGLAYFLDAKGADAHTFAFVSEIGSAFMAVFGLLLVAEIIAAVALLRGSSIGRIFVIVFGVLSLFKFPFGTALGGYTLWALLRKQPAATAEVIS